MFGNLLGKRDAGPIAEPSASGKLPDDVEGPPRKEPREQPPSSLEARLGVLEAAVGRQGEHIKTLERRVGAQNRLLELAETQRKADAQALGKAQAKIAELETALAKTATQANELDAKVTHPSYAAAAGANSAASELRAEQAKTKGDIELLKQQAEQQDRLARAGNVMLFGLEESDRMPPAEQVSELLRSVGAPSRDRIVRAVRVGSQRSDQPRPVKVVMVTETDAVGVLRRTRDLRQRRQVRVDRDLTPAQTERRREQLQPAADIRARGYVTVFNADKLFFFKKGSSNRTLYTGGSYPPRVHA